MNEIDTRDRPKLVAFPRIRLVSKARDVWDHISGSSGGAIGLLPGEFAMGWDGCEVSRGNARPCAVTRGQFRGNDHIRQGSGDGFFVASLLRMTPAEPPRIGEGRLGNSASLGEARHSPLRGSAPLREPTPLLRPLLHFHARQEGAVLVFVALAIAVLLGFAAFAVDFGSIFEDRRSLQNAVDAAALAGVHELPENPALAIQVAVDYAADNGAGSNVTAEVVTKFNTNDSIIVTSYKQNQPILRFAAVGSGDIEVGAQAQAIVAKAVDMCQIWPFAIQASDIEYGKELVLKVDNQSQLSPGNFGAIDVPGRNHGASNFEDIIKNKGCLTQMTVPTLPGGKIQKTFGGVQGDSDSAVQQCVHGFNPGKKNVPNRAPDCVNWHVDPPVSYACPGNPQCGLDTTPPGSIVQVPSCARIGIVPVVADGAFQNGKKDVTIVDFAAFYLVGMDTPLGNTDRVIGAFLTRVEVKLGDPQYGQPIGSLRGYFLWK